MRLMLFLGAGVSVLSGLPTAAELTEALLRSPRIQADRALQSVDMTRRILGLLHVLKKHDERDSRRVGYYRPGRGGRFQSSGAIYRGPTTYEDLFHLCQEIRFWNIGLTDNSLTTPLMEVIERQAGPLLQGRSVKARMHDLGSLATLACTFIESVVADRLSPSVVVGLDLVLELARSSRVDQLNIVTLNHDTLVERLLSDNGVEVVDGFGAPDGDVRWYDDAVYDNHTAKVRIFKLHGSINWYAFSAGGASRLAMFVGSDVDRARDRTGAPLPLWTRTPSFLSGVSKAVAYERGVYADIHFRVHQLLRQCDRMVMSGYGWGDMAINNRLEGWLDRSPENVLVLLHRTPDEIAGRSLVVATSYDGWTRTRKLIPVRKWLAEVTLDDIWGYLQSADR